MGGSCCSHQSKLSKYPQTEEEKSRMEKPFVADKCPKQVKLEVGKAYYYCTCGLSKSQPFCDGSHNGTKFKPMEFRATQEDNYLCQCKQTKNQPYCDGTHNNLDF